MDIEDIIRGLKKDFYLLTGTDIELLNDEMDAILEEKLYQALSAGVDKGIDMGNKQKKAVVMKDMYGNFLREFNGVHEAAREVGCAASNIINVLKSRQNSAMGFRWGYKNKKDEEDNG